MTTHGSNHKEHPSTYFVQDRSNKEELQRLQVQDHLLTVAMGGVLPEQPDSLRFRRVLDIGCGPGGWLIEMARKYPDCDTLIGVDVSKRIVEYARKQAYDAQQDHVEFHVMDALRMLEFPNAFFDLVNLRCASSYVRTWDWPKLLEEMRRVCRAGGILRLTEPEMVTESSSTALPLFCMHIQAAMYKAGHLFDNAPNGITAHLPIQDGFVHAYKGRATMQGVRAIAYLDTVEPGHWLPGHFQPDAYELTFSFERLSKKGRMDPDRLDDLGHFLIDCLRERMTDAMHAAGWHVVDHTNEGRAIWHHRPPLPALSAEQTPGTEADTSKEVRAQTRLVQTRAVTFTCVHCGREVTEQRFPSHTPLYCSNPACKQEATRRKTRARVANYRRLHPDARKKQQVEETGK